MEKMKIERIALINSVANIISQVFNVLSGIIIPRIILSYFGSEVNGLTTSLYQFLNYISLLEGGVGGVVVAALYKPLSEHDSDKVSSIIKTSNKFYHKISFIFIIYSLVLALTYPLIFESSFSYGYIFSLTFIIKNTFKSG